MTEDESYRLKPEYLLARIEHLDWMITVILGTMSEEQREYALNRLAEKTRKSEEMANAMDTDTARDRQVATYESAERFDEAVHEEHLAFTDQ